MSGSALTLLKTPFSICFVFVVLLSSCANDKAFEPVPMVIDTTCIPNGYQVTYTQDIKIILETYCTNPMYGSCHQSGSEYDYTFYEGIKEEADTGTLELRVLIYHDMPPPYSLGPKDLTSCELQKLSEWIYNGAPE
ncbi:MAG: hypothetical protein H0V65_07210 [Chitinophagales bacterium]|nr:hypothetical protein [Chitinophagales bacterium]